MLKKGDVVVINHSKRSESYKTKGNDLGVVVEDCDWGFPGVAYDTKKWGYIHEDYLIGIGRDIKLADHLLSESKLNGEHLR